MTSNRPARKAETTGCRRRSGLPEAREIAGIIPLAVFVLPSLTGCVPIVRRPAGLSLDLRPIALDAESSEPIACDVLVIPVYESLACTAAGPDGAGWVQESLAKPFIWRSGEPFQPHEPGGLSIDWWPWGLTTVLGSHLRGAVFYAPGYTVEFKHSTVLHDGKITLSPGACDGTETVFLSRLVGEPTYLPAESEHYIGLYGSGYFEMTPTLITGRKEPARIDMTKRERQLVGGFLRRADAGASGGVAAR